MTWRAAFAWIGVWAVFVAAMIVLFEFDSSRGRAAQPIETVTRETWRIAGREVECVRRIDHLNHVTTLSC